MKKILALILTAMLCLACVAALAEEDVPEGAKLVKPIPVEIDLNNIPDGEYPAEFEPDELKTNEIHLTIYAVDHYTDEDIKGLAVGDYILIDDDDLKIESVGTDEYGDVQINGGLVEDGYDLTMRDGDTVWTVAGLDDYPTWTALGEVTLPIDDDVNLIDGVNGDDKPLTAQGVQAVISAITSSEEDYFDEYNTTVTVKSGKVVTIHRVYNP
ncbi:MAG: hypothetical protein IJH86_00675 [Clostridia bacterium]|nr:hypothetical protein [Clostridia bacterium]